jgi:hypothetical protein
MSAQFGLQMGTGVAFLAYLLRVLSTVAYRSQVELHVVYHHLKSYKLYTHAGTIRSTYKWGLN